MEQYNVTGMSCAACSSRVEKAVSRVPGVTSCSVSLLTNSMGVEGTAGAGAVIKAVQDAGYGASLKGASGEQISASAAEEALEDHETPALKRRLIASVGFLLVLMYFSMGHMMWGWPLPAWFNDNHIAMEPSATRVSIFGARCHRLLKPLIKNFWFMTSMIPARRSCTSPMAI